MFKSFIDVKNCKSFEGKGENRLYNVPVKYTCKSFVNYLGPVYYNSMLYQYKKEYSLFQK